MTLSQTTETGRPQPDVQYLTFALAEEEYGVNVLKVQEIIGLTHITPVPRTPDFLSGLINLRGRVIPVLDLRLKLEIPAAESTEETCIIIVETRDRSAGFIVDRVNDVRGINPASIEPPPALGTGIRADYIVGMAKCEEGLKMLLDIDRVLTDQDEAVIDEVVKT